MFGKHSIVRRPRSISRAHNATIDRIGTILTPRIVLGMQPLNASQLPQLRNSVILLIE